MDRLHQLQNIRAKVYELQAEGPYIDHEKWFVRLSALVALCDQAIDFEIKAPIREAEGE